MYTMDQDNNEVGGRVLSTEVIVTVTLGLWRIGLSRLGQQGGGCFSFKNGFLHFKKVDFVLVH